MGIDLKLIDKLLAEHGHRPEDIAGEKGLLKQLTKALLERAMQAELTGHLGYEKHDPVGHNSGNSRNGKSHKKLKGDFGEMEVETPRDRNGTFEPKIIPKGQTRFKGFDEKILSMYARGMTTREIQGAKPWPRASTEQRLSPGAPRGDLRRRCQSDADFQCYRGGSG